MKLSTALKAYGYKITNGDEFRWGCWPNTQCINISNNDTNIVIYYNLNTTEIHEIIIDLAGVNNLFKWFNPPSLKSYKKEAISRTCNIEENDPLTRDIQGLDPTKYVTHTEILDLITLKLSS